MKFNNSNVIVYKDNSSFILNIGEIPTKFNSQEISPGEYEILDDIYINTLNSSTKIELSNIAKINPAIDKIELTKINKVYKIDNIDSLNYININDDINFLSNIICFNNKQKNLYIQGTNNLEKKYAVQNNMDINISPVTIIDNLDLNISLGYLVGYWLLRGGFFKVDRKNEEFPSWSGREQDTLRIKHILNNQTSLTKSFKENLELILLLDPNYNNFFRNNFITNNNKTTSPKKLPDWILIAKQSFLQGLFYGLVAANSYISNDSKGNFYLAIKITNSNIITLLHDIFKIRLGIYSRVIGDNNHLSFKFNNKLYNALLSGIEQKYIFIDNFDDIIPISNKEIIHNHFKIIPWYKFKKNINNLTTSTGYSLSLGNNGESIIMLSNGLFTSC